MAKSKSILPNLAAIAAPTWHWKNQVFQETYPALYEFLAAGVTDDGPRKGGSINLFCDRGKLKVCFTDKQTQLAFYAELEGGGDFLTQLEGILSGEHEMWQPVKRNDTKIPF